MKKIVTSIVLLFCTAASANETPTIRDQLSALNHYWQFHPLQESFLDARIKITSDKELIQIHLTLVEKTLRATPHKDWSSSQLKKRSIALDHLRNYYQRGVFPKNTGHANRTPYFIDCLGTACAVGQLIIESGHEAVAKKIASENNNGYIVELKKSYPEIEEWASENGFTCDELAWIQPCYGHWGPDTIGFRQPTCFEGRNGYFFPDFSSLEKPITKILFLKIDTSWINIQDPCGGFWYDALSPGEYRWTANDANSQVHHYYATLTAPPAASVAVNWGGDFATCMSSASISVQGGAPPIAFRWKTRPDTIPVVTGLCESFQRVIVYEGKSIFCGHVIDFFVGPVGLVEQARSDLKVFPNPSSDELMITLPESYRDSKVNFKVLNSQGQLIFHQALTQFNPIISVREWPEGVFLIQLETGDHRLATRFVKQ